MGVAYKRHAKYGCMVGVVGVATKASKQGVCVGGG